MTMRTDSALAAAPIARAKPKSDPVARRVAASMRDTPSHQTMVTHDEFFGVPVRKAEKGAHS